MASIFAPVLYLVVVIGSLLIFSTIYKRRVATRLANDPWFPAHPDRDAYVTLLQQDPPAHETLLKAALLRRAVADVHRLMRVREDKTALNALLQKGSISDDLWTRFLATEKELEAEILEVISEANTFREGWGQIIFSSASEIVQNERTRDAYVKLNKDRAALLESKTKRRAKPAIAPVQTPAAQQANGTPSKPDAPLPATSIVTNGHADPTADAIDSTKTPTTPAVQTPTSAKKGKKRK